MSATEKASDIDEPEDDAAITVRGEGAGGAMMGALENPGAVAGTPQDVGAILMCEGA